MTRWLEMTESGLHWGPREDAQGNSARRCIVPEKEMRSRCVDL